MKIKDELVLQGMTQAAVDEIEYNTIGAFQTSDCKTHGYSIVKWTGNAYTLQEIYKCHAFDPPVIIAEGDNHVMLSNQKHVSTLQSYGAIINGILPN